MPLRWLIAVLMAFFAAGTGSTAALGVATTYTVNSTADPGADGICDPTECTLREAIDAANGDGMDSDISFDIPGAGVQTISPASPLPTLTSPVLIDGYTQPGASPNTLAVGSDALLQIQLDGSALGGLDDGLTITGGGSTVRGLVLNRFPDAAIELQTAGGNVVEGNHIGTNAEGTAGLGNANGVVMDASPSNTIGGTAPEDRNVISGNVNGVVIFQPSATENAVLGNYIGTDAAGTGGLGNSQFGVWLFSQASNNTIGGAAPGARNVISANVNGVYLTDGVAGNVFQGNYIGTDATGTAALGNVSVGVISEGGGNNTIGGTAPGAGNVISGNGNNGIHLTSTTGGVIQGNYIGTDAAGTSPLGNAAIGIALSNTSEVVIGGTEAGAGNTIAFNGEFGVGGFAWNNMIRRNSIHSNAGLGIDLFPAGPNLNDPNDVDATQNYPEFTAVQAGSNVAIESTLDSTPNDIYDLDFYTNDGCDPSRFGEGQTFLGTTFVITDNDGNAEITETFPGSLSPGTTVTGTATDSSGNTSEFSPCDPSPPIVVNSTNPYPSAGAAPLPSAP